MSSCRTQFGKLKVKHANRAAAEEHALAHQKTTRIQIDVYRCPKCHYWHIGRHKTTKAEKYSLNTHRRERTEEIQVGILIGILRKVLDNATR